MADLKYWESGSSASPPPLPASPSIGFPTAGNPGSGTPATTPGEYWFFQVQAEIDQFITSAGLTLDHMVTNQMALAASLYVTNAFSQSLAQNGYTTLPNGLIIQWGIDGLSGHPDTVTLPIAFPTLFGAVVAIDGDTVPAVSSAEILSLTQFKMYNEGNNWIAIGY